MTDKTERDALVAKLREANEHLIGAFEHHRAITEAIEALAAPAEGGQGEAVGRFFVSEVSQGAAYIDLLEMTAAGRKLPVGEYLAYTTPPAASVDVDGLRMLADEIEYAKTPIPRRALAWANRIRLMIDSAGGAKVERPERCTECRSSTFETRHDGSFICANCKTIYATPQPAEGDGAVTLESAPIGTQAPAIGGGHWTRVEGGWKWCNGATFPRPGGDWDGRLILPKDTRPSAAAAGRLKHERAIRNFRISERSNEPGSA